MTLGIGACDAGAGDTSDARVVPDTPFDPTTGECATNWRPVDLADLGTRARVENERLVLESRGGTVAVQGLLGVAPTSGRGEVLRFDFYQLGLGGPDGRFDIEMVSPEGTLARLIVQPKGAVLTVESSPYGSNAEIQFDFPPERLVFELDLQASQAVEGRAFFFEAGRGKVLATNVPRFAGGTVTSLLTLSGTSAVAKLERFARIDPGSGGLMEDFRCDSLGPASDRFRFPEGRASKAGKPCTHDDQCGAGEMCSDAVCQRVCLASSQCLDTVCIVLESGGLCSAPSDACEPPPGLVCGGDGAVRLGCERNLDCPHVSDLCIGGACVSNDESATQDGKSWGQCEFGSERCEGDTIQACDTDGPGWNPVEQCAAGQCKDGGGEALCDDCARSCQGEDLYQSCAGGPLELALDCPDGFEVCSTGDSASEPAHCRAVIAAAPPQVAVEVGGPSPWHIDPNEVTRAEYTAFLQSAPALAAQSADCAWNDSFRPPDWPFFDAPDHAVLADFCDAQAYCASVGKSLCTTEQWYDTCSAGGTLDYPYGDAFESGVCSVDPRRDVGTSPECVTSGAWAGVYDILGGVGEWLDACAHGTTSVRAADSCKTRGTSASETCQAERTLRRDSVAGIRCCAP